MAALFCLVMVAAIWFMAYNRFALWQWSAVLAGLMLVATILGVYSTLALTLHWLALPARAMEGKRSRTRSRSAPPPHAPAPPPDATACRLPPCAR